MDSIKYFLLAKSLGAYINLLRFFRPEKAAALSYYYFSRPRYGKLDAGMLPEILSKAERSTLHFNSHPIACYRWKGDGPTVLLLHGWESNAARWERLMPFLGDFNVIAIDAPGHGLSSTCDFNVPLYAAFADVAVRAFNPDFVIAHSMGGITALYFLRHFAHPGIRKAVILGAPSEMKTIVGNFAGRLGLSGSSVADMNDFLHRRYDIHPDDFSGSAFARDIAVETFVAHDEGDDVVAFAEGERIGSALPKGRFHKITGSGHRMHDDGLYALIRNFLLEESVA